MLRRLFGVRQQSLFLGVSPGFIHLSAHAGPRLRQLFFFVLHPFTGFFLPFLGNVAWMHILAARALRERPETLGGEAFYCYDESPYKSYDEFNMQFLSTFNFRRLRIPQLILWFLAIVNDVLRWILSPVYAFTPLLNRYTYATVTTSFTVSTDKASRHFQYRPLYSWDQCKERTQKWVDSFAEGKDKDL